MIKQRLDNFCRDARVSTILPALTDAESKSVNKFMGIFYFLFVPNLFVVAQNPISPHGVYIADPSAHVLQAKIKPTQGVHALWIKFAAEEGVSIDIDWFRFL